MNAVAASEKACPKCGEVKPLSGFYRNRSLPDGHDRRCIPCHRESIDASRAKRKAEDPEGFRLRNLQSVVRYRARTGDARNKAMGAAKREATRRLVEAHRRQFDALYLLVRAERGLLKDGRYEVNR